MQKKYSEDDIRILDTEDDKCCINMFHNIHPCVISSLIGKESVQCASLMVMISQANTHAHRSRRQHYRRGIYW